MMVLRRKTEGGDPLSRAERAAVQDEARKLADDPEFWSGFDRFSAQVAAGEIQTEPVDTDALRRRLEAQRKRKAG